MPAPAPALYAPFSVPLQEALDRALRNVPAGKRGWLSLGLARAGAEVAIGWKPRPGVALSGYGAGPWGRRGWDLWARATVTW